MMMHAVCSTGMSSEHCEIHAYCVVSFRNGSFSRENVEPMKTLQNKMELCQHLGTGRGGKRQGKQMSGSKSNRAKQSSAVRPEKVGPALLFMLLDGNQTLPVDLAMEGLIVLVWEMGPWKARVHVTEVGTIESVAVW